MLFDVGYYDQKWSVWDTWRAFGRNVRVYLVTVGYKMSNLVTAQYRRGNAVTAQKRRGNIITGV